MIDVKISVTDHAANGAVPIRVIEIVAQVQTRADAAGLLDHVAHVLKPNVSAVRYRTEPLEVTS